MDLSQFTIAGEQDKITSLQTHNGRLIRLRWFYLSLLVAIAAISNALSGHQEIARQYLIIGLVGLAVNGLFALLNRFPLRHRAPYVLMLAQLALDLILASVSVYTQGGLVARTTVLYALPIVATGLIFSEAVVYITAIAAGLGYVACILLYGYNHGVTFTLSNYLSPAAFYPAFFIIFAQIVIYLMRVTTHDTREKAYDAFLALLSHQLKHPVSTVNAIIDHLETTSHLPPDQQKYIGMLKAENQSLLLLLNNLLETATPVREGAASEEVDLPPLLQRLAHRSAENHIRSVDLKLKLHDMAMMVEANGERLSTGLLNVLNNAFQYSEKGTPVSVSIRKAGDNVIVTIENKGNGLQHISRQHPLEKFSVNVASERSVQGLGLGLFVAQKILAEHNGSLHVVGDKSGTKVLITLRRSKHE